MIGRDRFINSDWGLGISNWGLCTPSVLEPVWMISKQALSFNLKILVFYSIRISKSMMMIIAPVER
jgi:hypothetical protein